MGYDELFAVTDGIKERTAPETSVYLWGFEPAFYLAVDRPYPGRFPFSYPLVTPWAPARWREEFPEAGCVELPDAGHFVQEDDPDACVAAIREVLAAVEE